MSEFLRKPEIDVTQGVDFAIPSAYLPPGKNYPQNMQLFRGELRKREGRSVLGSRSLGGHKVNHLAVFSMTSGIERLIRHTKQNVQRFLANTSDWEDITGLDMTGSETDFYQSCVVSEMDLFLFTNYIDNIRKYNDSALSTDLGGNPPKCSAIEYVSPYVMIGNISTGGRAIPQKVQWCDTGQPEVWDGGNSGSEILGDDPTNIHVIKKLLDYAMVYKEGSVYRGRKVSSASIFDFGGPFVSGKGTLSPRVVASDGQNHYYMGRFDFHKNNSVRVSDIGGPVREYIFNRLNRARVDTCHALHVEIYKEVWFFITVGGNDWPTEVWKYNYERGQWYYDSVVDCLTAANFKQTVDLTWDTDPGSWDDEIDIWDAQQGMSGAPFQVFGKSDGFVERLNSNLVDDRGVAIDARVDTGDYTGLAHKGIEFDTRWLQFQLFVRGSGIVKLYYSKNYGSTWVYINSKEMTPFTERYDFYFDVIAEHIRFRIQCDGVGDYFTLRNFTPLYLDEGEIEK